jgi:hypothetical protein
MKMMEGFLQLRRGIEVHLLNGEISFTDFGVYTTMLLQADYRTGQWIGSAPRLAATATRGANLRAIQRSLEQLQLIGFIKVFRASATVRGNYKVLIDKFEPTAGPHKGQRLDAEASDHFSRPVFRVVEESLTERCDDVDETLTSRSAVAVTAPSQDEDCKKEIEINRDKNAIAIGSRVPNQSQLKKQLRNDVAEDLTLLLHDLIMENNPNAKAPQSNWASLWKRDIAELLQTYSEADLRDIIHASQTPRFSRYVVRGEGLLKMAERIMGHLRRNFAEATACDGSSVETPQQQETNRFDTDNLEDGGSTFNVEVLDGGDD